MKDRHYNGEAVIHIDRAHSLKGFIIGALLMGTSSTVSASELGAFNQQVADAYAPYRSAMFYLRTGNPGVAFLDLDTASERWQSVVDRFASTAPDAFADDREFAATLSRVESALDAGKSALDAGDEEAATTALATIRTDLSDLRRRNGLRAYSDCIDDMNAAMDRLWTYRHEPPAFDQDDQVNAVKREAAVTEFLYRRCYETAPAEFQERDTFKRLFEGSLISLPLIFGALDRGNEAQLINILRELRSFDRMIWLEFG